MQLESIALQQQEEALMKSPIVKRSIVIGGHMTSVSLEDAFWRGLKDVARTQRTTLSTMVGEIDKSRRQSNLSSAIRLFVLDRLRAPAPNIASNGHDRVETEHMVLQSVHTRV